MRILVTGGAGFIGFHIIQALLLRGDEVTNIDNINSYYSIKLKNDRLELLESNQNKGRYNFIKIDLADRRAVSELFEKSNFHMKIVIYNFYFYNKLIKFFKKFHFNLKR